MITALPTWQSKLKEKVKASFPKQEKDKQAGSKAWQEWIGEVGKGMAVSAPYFSEGTANKSMFAPLVMPPAQAGNPATVAQIYAAAWFAWYMGIQWSPHKGPPPPPFQKVLTIVPSAIGAATQQPILMAKLIAEFTVPSKEEKRYDNMAKYFYEATLGAGVMISGVIPGTPPMPLVIPQWPIM